MKKDFSNTTISEEEMIDINSNNINTNNNSINRRRHNVYADGYTYNDTRNAYSNANYNNGKNKNVKKSKKKLVIILSCVLAVIIALGVTGTCLYISSLPVTKNEKGEFIYPEGTVVSGVSIAGKTYNQAKQLLENKKESFIKPVKIAVDIRDNTAMITEKDFDYTYDIDAVLKSLKKEILSDTKPETTEKKGYTITATVTENSINRNVEKIANDNDLEPEDAFVKEFKPYSDQRFSYSEQKNGFKMDKTDLQNKIKGVITSGVKTETLTAVGEVLYPNTTVEFLKENIVKLASYKTISYNTAAGTSNMKVSLKACNGSIIDPGETWSFNNCTGNSNLESNGYKKAAVISNGKSDIGVGGGICQSSSTIYNAAIRANMAIVERHNHKWASSYVPTGLDATIDYGNLDLKLKNTSDYQMFLECKVVDSVLYVTFWGYKSPNYDKIIARNEMGDKKGKTYTVNAWRVYIKDGKEIDREELDSSVYDVAHGYYFQSATNDSGVFDQNIDNYEDSVSSGNNSSSSSSSHSSSSTAAESSYTQSESSESNSENDTETSSSAESDEQSEEVNE